MARNQPELGVYREIQFYFHLALVPSHISIVKRSRWQEKDAKIHWTYQGFAMMNNMVYVVGRAFDRMDTLQIKVNNIYIYIYHFILI